MNRVKTIFIALLFSGVTFTSWGQDPDIAIDVALLASSLTIDENYDVKQCEFDEGCALATGNRKVLRFDTRTLNVGSVDFVVGVPPPIGQDGGFFVWADCTPGHLHHHFETFANIQLYDLNCNLVRDGAKMGFEIIDFPPITGTCDTYTSSNQGITAGCSDLYDKGLPCQILDIDGLANGRYIFFVELNFEQKITESAYSNNTAYLLIEIDGNDVEVLNSGHDFTFSANDNITTSPALCTLLNAFAPFFILRANNQITSDCDHSSAQNSIQYKAGERIVLTNGFRSGPDFHAEIIHCSHNENEGPNKKGTTTNNEQPPPDQSPETQSPSSEEGNVDITIYPNPNQGEFQLAVSKGQEAKVYIYDILGNLIYNSSVRGTNSETIDISRHGKGIYFIKVQQGEQIFTEKLIHQ